MKNKLQTLILSFGLFQLCLFSGFSQIIADGTYQIYSETHDATLESPTDVNQDDSSNGQINNLFGSTSDVNNAYQLFEFIHQGSDIYKIKNIGTNQFIGIKDNWCGNGGEVIARYAETDTNVEFFVSQDAISGQFIIQIAFTNCNFGSVNDPARSFDLGSSTGSVRTFGDTGGNQQFRLKSISPVVSDRTYRIFTDATNSFIESPVNVNQDDSGDATVNNLFAAALDEANNFQQFQFTYQYTNPNGDIYSIRNLGTNQYIGLKDNFCGDFGEVIARFAENDAEAQIVISKDENSGKILFQKSDSGSCSYFDLTGSGKIRTFNDTGFNQQFRAIPTTTYIYDNSWSPSAPTGGEDVLILNGTFATASDLDLNSILIANNASMEITAGHVLTINKSFNNQGNFTFKSNNSGSAQLANLSGVEIRGDVSIERFIPKRNDNGRAFRFLASAVGNVNIADAWQQQTHITGAVGNVGETSVDGFDETLSGAPSMFEYNHQLEDQINNNAWQAISSTNQDIELGKPYRLYVRGNRSINLESNTTPATDVTLRATGNLHTGEFEVETSNFANNFSFIGNPYQAVVNLNNLTYGNGVNTNSVYYWDPSLGTAGGFVTISLPGGVPNPSSTNANEFLRPGQAVFIQNNNTGSDYSIRFNEDDKTTSGTQTQVFTTGTQNAFINLRIYKTDKFENGEAEEDALGYRFIHQAHNEINQNDATKMGNPGINLAAVNNNKLLAIETRNIPTETTALQVFLNNLENSNYTFRIHKENFAEHLNVSLLDAYLGTSIPITENIQTYSFDVDQAIPSSMNILRFSLVIENVSLSTTELELNDTLKLYPNPVENLLYIQDERLQNRTISYTIFDLKGRKLLANSLDVDDSSKFQINTNSLSKGVYMLRINTKDQKIYTRKIIKK